MSRFREVYLSVLQIGIERVSGKDVYFINFFFSLSVKKGIKSVNYFIYKFR